MIKIFARITSLAQRELIYKKTAFFRKTSILISRFKHDDSFFFVDEQRELCDPEYIQISNEYLGIIAKGHRVFVIQPYIKWGRNKKYNTTKNLQIDEAVALVKTLPYWTVADKICVPLLSFERQQLFGKGTLEIIKKKLNGNSITAVFISVNTLRHEQILMLAKIFGVPVYDRYSLVIHIFRSHAKSPEAKIQVAIAELPYIYQKMSEINGRINLLEKRKLYLHAREAKLKGALEKIKQYRNMTRTRRKKIGIPTIAFVGYTNAGKTSVIKALTGDEGLEPKNYLFATLDTTGHEGFLPCKMKVLYIDTIGFIQDVPETLLAPFNTTIEDAMFADIIVHVYDVSHPDSQAQIDHVRNTLKVLSDGNRPMIEIANKCDLIRVEELPDEAFAISATKLTGIDALRYSIQDLVLKETGRSITKMRVESGSEPYLWIYKETTVLNVEVDPENSQFLFLDVVTSQDFFHRFRYFLKHYDK
ncbi:PREDICTED: putative GTP-binding protein 6 [Ceratosolen solmsi marchali]|uniref:GTP-binding protein 6 n=1 Tax=Ceratosolen solmsi marchali TaxID=326594 RepID=A0AAJ7DXN1_9HYME|nr:PREDICTED: putative GTP-binding protein 6 [Ceratosolen solmsi marchali]